MKCKFESTTSYGSQTFLRGQTYDLPEKTAAAMGFAKARVVPEEPKLEEMKLVDLKAKAIEVGNDSEVVNKLVKKSDVIELIKNPVILEDEPVGDEDDDEPEEEPTDETDGANG